MAKKKEEFHTCEQCKSAAKCISLTVSVETTPTKKKPAEKVTTITYSNLCKPCHSAICKALEGIEADPDIFTKYLDKLVDEYEGKKRVRK